MAVLDNPGIDPVANAFPPLFEPLRIRGCTLKNRIMSTGHDTTLPVDGTVNEALVAYQEARARGGAGLIVLQVSGVHETARYTNHVLMATDDSVIPGYRRVAEAVHRFDTVLFAQLFHPGREIAEADGGLLSVAYAPSAVPNERFHVMPSPLKLPMIRAIVSGYGDAARRMQPAGVDGVEIVASHGYLPSQFLNPRGNLRDDAYGGDLDGRLRFLRAGIADIRGKLSEPFVVGLRISGFEVDESGLPQDASLQSTMRVADTIDYVNATRGRKYGTLSPARVRRKVMVVGGGPAGMKAAIIAAQRGHRVILHEAQKRLGGQALLAQLLPGRAEFGGLVTNLLHEMAAAGVEVHLGSQVDRAMIESESPDVVVMATGATPYRPDFASEGALQIADAWQILRESVEPGQSVVVVDWRADWIGIGIAERLAQSGRRVRLAGGAVAGGESVPFSVRYAYVAYLPKLR